MRCATPAKHRAHREVDGAKTIPAPDVFTRASAAAASVAYRGCANASPATAKRYWVFARAWLYGKLHGDDGLSLENPRDL